MSKEGFILSGIISGICASTLMGDVTFGLICGLLSMGVYAVIDAYDNDFYFDHDDTKQTYLSDYTKKS